MRELPVRARVFWAVICVAGICSCLAAARYPFPKSTAPPWEYVLFTVLAALAGGRKIRLTRSKVESDEGSMSLGFALAFAAMLRCGPVGGLLANTSACFAGCLFPRRQKPPQFLFNVGLTAIESLLAGFVFLLLNGWTLKLSPAGSFLAIMTSCLTFFMANTGGVATIIALCTDQNPVRVWRETFQWTATSYLTGACASALAMVLFADHAATILLFVTPAAYFTYQFYGVQTERAAEKQQHIEQLQLSQEHLAELYLATIKSLALAIDAKDQYTHQHILRVQRYAVATAQHMGISGSDLDGITTGALLHDIGKLGVPEYVLLKPGRLTDDEFAKIKKHPEIGAAILEPVDFPWPVLPVVKYHHEKWDGTGYPEGLKGEEIPLLARILAVADVYDALTSTRSYRNAWTHEKTKEVIQKDSGTHFDPVVAAAFLEIIDGIVEEMAANGEGPLAMKSTTARPALSTTDHAAREINRASSELWALYEVAQTLSSSLGLNETLEILARKLEAILPGTAILFLLKGEEEGRLDVRAAVGVNVPFFLNAATLGPRSRSIEVMTTGATFCGEFDADDLMPNSCETAAWTPLDSAIIVPIIHQGERLGTINLYHPLGNAFSDHDVKLLELIAERAALALYNGLLYDRARSNALTDAVTGLRNVRYLTEHVEQKCRLAEQNSGLRLESDAFDSDSGAVRHDDRFALLCLDLDSFKPINDNFGHQKGDQVLVDLGRLFTSLVRPGDVVARYGGDEFLIVLNDAGPDEASRMADRIQQGVEQYDPQLLHPKLGALRLGVSVGYACFPHDGRECGALLSVADARMYTDKTERKLGNLKGRSASGDAAGERDMPRAA